MLCSFCGLSDTAAAETNTEAEPSAAAVSDRPQSEQRSDDEGQSVQDTSISGVRVPESRDDTSIISPTTTSKSGLKTTLTEDHKKAAREVFASEIALKKKVTMGLVQSKLMKHPTLRKLACYKFRVKQVVNYLTYLISIQPTKEPSSLPKSDETKKSLVCQAYQSCREQVWEVYNLSYHPQNPGDVP